MLHRDEKIFGLEFCGMEYRISVQWDIKRRKQYCKKWHKPQADCCTHAAFFRLDMLKCLSITFVLTWRDASYERRRCVIHSYRALLKIFCLQLSSKRLSGWLSHPENKKNIWKRKKENLLNRSNGYLRCGQYYISVGKNVRKWQVCSGIIFLLCLIDEMDILETWYSRKKEYCNEHWEVCSISTQANQ